jgi:hypothetical protein
MDEVIELNFVYSNDAYKIKEFLGNVPRSIECINYIEIVNKLTKNDYYQYEPSDTVVSSYLIRQIQSAFERDSLRSLFYVLSSVEEDVISNIKKYTQSLTNKEIRFNLYYSTSIDIKESFNLFDNINEFE